MPPDMAIGKRRRTLARRGTFMFHITTPFSLNLPLIYANWMNDNRHLVVDVDTTVNHKQELETLKDRESISE